MKICDFILFLKVHLFFGRYLWK